MVERPVKKIGLESRGKLMRGCSKALTMKLEQRKLIQELFKRNPQDYR